MNRMMKNLCCSIVILGFILINFAQSQSDPALTSKGNDVYYFDFGTYDSPIEKGFERITPSDVWGNDRHFGWISNSTLEAVDNPVDGKKFPPSIYTTNIRRDSIQSARPATFCLKLSPGKYMVWAMIGTGGGNWGQVWDITISSNDNKGSATFAGPETARIISFNAATDSKGLLEIKIDTRSRWAINALIIAPLQQWPSIQTRIVDRLENSIIILPDDILKYWNHTPHREYSRQPEYTPQELKRGFLIYKKPWITPIWPNSLPYREQCDPKLETFMARDEYEPLTFTILPLRNFKSVALRPISLKDSVGNTIPAEDIDVRYVQYKFGRPDYKTLGEYYKVPDILRPFDKPVPLVAMENFRIWLTLHTKKQTAPGLYEGKAEVMLDGKMAAAVPIKIRVLPINLLKDPTVTYSTYYRHPSRYQNQATDDFSRKWWAAKIDNDMKSMVAHGYNSFRPDINVAVENNGNIVVDLSELQKQFEQAAENGMDINRPTMGDLRACINKLYKQYTGKKYPLHLFGVKMPPQAFFDKVTEIVTKTEAERKKSNLPEILYSLVDEPAATPESIAFTHKIYAAAKKVKGVRTYVTVAPSRKEFSRLYSVIDVWSSPQLNNLNIDRMQLAKSGIEIWCYPNYIAGENDHTPVAGARMTYGFARWKSGAPCLIPWIFESWGGDPENYLDSLQSDMFNHTSDDADVLPCTLYEAYREGVDDNRYITTLEYLIKQAKQAGLNKLADSAQDDLYLIWKAIPIQEEYKYDTGWNDENFDGFRLLLAKRILLLQEKLNKSGEPKEK